MLSRQRTNARTHRFGWLIALTILAGAAGCVERRMIIATDPSGAIVYDEKNQPIGASPVDKTFVYYGSYRFRIAKDGYETLVVDQKVRSPWYELPGLDFVAENLIPWTIRDVRRFTYVMQKQTVRTQDQLLMEAQLMREYGKTIGEPLPEFPPPPTMLLPPKAP